jgi:hypothetical protein
VTKNVGHDFDFDHPSHSGQREPVSRTPKILPQLFDLLMPLVIALIALYVGRDSFGL